MRVSATVWSPGRRTSTSWWSPTPSRAVGCRVRVAARSAGDGCSPVGCWPWPGPALTAALRGSLMLNWFFTPPQNTLSRHGQRRRPRALPRGRGRGRVGRGQGRPTERRGRRGVARAGEYGRGRRHRGRLLLPRAGTTRSRPPPARPTCPLGLPDAPRRRAGTPGDCRARRLRCCWSSATGVRTALLAAVSHDLRTPLAGIKAAVSSLRSPDVAWSRPSTSARTTTSPSLSASTSCWPGCGPSYGGPRRPTSRRSRRASSPRSPPAPAGWCPSGTAPGGLGTGRREGDQLPTGYMATLRRKLESDPSRPRHLVTEPGMGYRFLA